MCSFVILSSLVCIPYRVFCAIAISVEDHAQAHPIAPIDYYAEPMLIMSQNFIAQVRCFKWESVEDGWQCHYARCQALLCERALVDCRREHSTAVICLHSHARRWRQSVHVIVISGQRALYDPRYHNSACDGDNKAVHLCESWYSKAIMLQYCLGTSRPIKVYDAKTYTRVVSRLLYCDILYVLQERYRLCLLPQRWSFFHD